MVVYFCYWSELYPYVFIRSACNKNIIILSRHDCIWLCNLKSLLMNKVLLVVLLCLIAVMGMKLRRHDEATDVSVATNVYSQNDESFFANSDE